MSANIAQALAAYATTGQPSAKGAESIGAGSEFGALLRDAATDAIDTGRRADALSVAAVDGKATVTDVVTAVSEAELTLQTVIAVRDRVVQAYKDIISMPI